MATKQIKIAYLLATICLLVTGRVTSNVFHPDKASVFNTSKACTGINKKGKNKAARNAIGSFVNTRIIKTAQANTIDVLVLFRIE